MIRVIIYRLIRSDRGAFGEATGERHEYAQKSLRAAVDVETMPSRVEGLKCSLMIIYACHYTTLSFPSGDDEAFLGRAGS